MDFNKIAQEVVKNIGGKENIAVMEHCATRLRIVAKDNDKVSVEGLSSLFLWNNRTITIWSNFNKFKGIYIRYDRWSSCRNVCYAI